MWCNDFGSVLCIPRSRQERKKRPQKLKKTMNNSLKTFLSLLILVGVVSAASLRPKHYGPLPRYNFHTHKYTKNSNHDLTTLFIPT